MANFQGGDGRACGGHGIGVGGKRTTFPRMTLAAFLTSASLGALSLAMPAVAQVRAESVSFDIPSQPVNEALLAFARQAGVRLVMPDAQFGNVRSNPVRGAYDRDSALAELLRGTGVAARLENGAIVLQRSADASRAIQGAAPNASEEPVQLAQATPPRTGTADVTADERRTSGEVEDGDDRVVIVGTNIRGVYPASSPVDVYTAQDIERMGVTTMQGFIERLPQNLGTRSEYASGINTVAPQNRNFDAVSSPDLRGLGVGTTLTLLNGRRLSPSDFGQAVDISMIPASAIERVEVLTDGASAIYGSDAIGGVVNFVLRDDFEGAETRLNYGAVTDGRLRRGGMSHTFGDNWGSGYGVASFNYSSASALERADRDFAAPAGSGTLTPVEHSYSGLVTISQDIGDRLVLSGDFGLSRRNIKTVSTLLSTVNPLFDARTYFRGNSDQGFANFDIDYSLTDDMNASLVASYSRSDLDDEVFVLNYNRNPQTFAAQRRDTSSSILDVTTMLDGSLWQLPGGAARFSLGGGVLEEEFRAATKFSGVPSGRDLGRETTYAFAEIFAPLVGDAQNIPLLHRLELSIAARYTSFEDASNPLVDQDFGDAVDPKIGVLWEPFDGLGLRGTYGTSFRAPALAQIDPTGGTRNVFITTVAGASATVLTVANFPATELEPETAETYTVGFDVRPTFFPNLRLSGTYYNISYADRIGTAPLGGINPFTSPLLLPDAIYRAPSAAFIENLLGGIPPTLSGITFPGVDLTNPEAAAAAIFARPNLWIRDIMIRNLALSEQDGFDLSIASDFDTSLGDINVGANLTRILSYSQQGSPSSPVLTVADFVAFPTDLRGRVFAGLTSGGLNATLNVNYVDDTRFRTATGATTPVDSWATTDLYLSYDFEGPGALNGLRIGFSATNLFDEDPPFVNQVGFTQIGFDSANANPLGRLVTVSLTKRW